MNPLNQLLTLLAALAALHLPALGAPAAAPATLTLPAGTTLLVRLVDPVSSKDAPGKRFTTALEMPLTVNGTVIVPAGGKVYGRVEGAQQAGRYAGRSSLDLRLTDLAVGPNLVPIVTGSYAEQGAGSLRKTARGAAAGAAIGAIADGGDGAGTGAAIGAVASGLRRGETSAVNPGELLEFRLQQPVTVTIVN